MVDGFSRGNGHKELGAGHGSDRCSDVDSRLSVLASDKEGSQRCASLRHETILNELLASMRNADGGSAASGEREDSEQAMLHDSGGLPVSGEWDGEDGDGSENGSVQSAETFELAQLSDVADRYRQSLEEAVAPIAEHGLRNPDDVLAAKSFTFDNLIQSSLATAQEIQNIPIPPEGHPDRIRIIGIKKDLAVAVINSGLKADENMFRRKQHDALKELYDKVEAAGKIRTIN